MPVVSVIMPMYNCRETIERAVRSVMKQTVSDWELVVVDDGSTDGSDKVLENLIAGQQWIRVLRQDRSGAAAARNRGMEEANAELVAFPDAFDQWLPEFLETVLGLKERFSDCSLWATRYLVAGPRGHRATPQWTGLPEAEGVIKNYLATIGRYPPIRPGSAVILKKCLDSVGGFPEGVEWGEDLDTWLRLSLRYRFAIDPRACHIHHTGSSRQLRHRTKAHKYPLLSAEVEKDYADKIGLLKRHEIAEYFNWMRLLAAAECLRLGQRKTAKELLYLARNTERFRPTWQRASLKSHLPGWLMRLLSGIRAVF